VFSYSRETLGDSPATETRFVAREIGDSHWGLREHVPVALPMTCSQFPACRRAMSRLGNIAYRSVVVQALCYKQEGRGFETG
jgi:hypothetical protein